MTTVSFELGISLGEVAKTRFEATAVPKLEDAFTWFVQCAGETVTVHALVGRRVVEIGRAAWLQERLIERTGSPTDAQWKTVATALGRVLRRNPVASAPWWRRIDPRARPIIGGAIVMGCLAIGGSYMLYRIRTRAPHRESIAQFDRIAWKSVARGGETTVPLILKDPERERGRKLCVTGTVGTLERTKIDTRDVHRGTLRTDDMEIPVIALRNTGTIAARAPATLCGVAHGKQIVGLFDLPENK